MAKSRDNISERLGTHQLVSSDVVPCDPVDLLTEMLASTRTRGALFARSWLPESWGFRFAAEHAQCFHVIVHGPCWLRLDGSETFIPLESHDLVLVGCDHDLASDPEAVVRPFAPDAPELRSPPGLGACIACGAYAYDGEGPHPVFDHLPPLIHVPQSHRSRRIARVVDLLLTELDAPGAGAQTLVERLVDSLLIYVLREWIEGGSGERLGWLAALRDPNLAQVLALMHRGLDRPWTLSSLARASGLSRAALARRFHAVVDVPPMEFLRNKRLETARRLLRSSSQSIDEIASRVGYATGFSLSKAFVKAFGEAPGAYRERSRC